MEFSAACHSSACSLLVNLQQTALLASSAVHSHSTALHTDLPDTDLVFRPGADDITYNQTTTATTSTNLTSRIIAIVDAYLNLAPGTNPFIVAAGSPQPQAGGGGSSTGAIVGGEQPVVL